MAAVQGGVRFDKIAEKWHALAQRRLAYFGELVSQRSMEMVLRQGRIQAATARRRTRDMALGRARGAALGKPQKRYPASRLRLSYAITAAAAAAFLTAHSQVATAQSLKRGETLLTRTARLATRSAAPARARARMRRPSARSASAIRSSRWKRRWARASCPATPTCRNSRLTPRCRCHHRLSEVHPAALIPQALHQSRKHTHEQCSVLAVSSWPASSLPTASWSRRCASIRPTMAAPMTGT